MKIKVLVVMSIFAASCTWADTPFVVGLKEGISFFAPEIMVAMQLGSAIQQAGNIAPVVDHPFVQNVRENYAQCVAEYPVFIEWLRDVYTQPEALGISKNFNNALREFFEDPALAIARSGQEIIALQSYKQLKECHAIAMRFSKNRLQQYEARMPLISAGYKTFFSYIGDLYTRCEKASAYVTLKKTVGELLQDTRLTDEKFSAAYKELIANFQLNDEGIIEQQQKAIGMLESFSDKLKAMSPIMENELVWHILRTVTVEELKSPEGREQVLMRIGAVFLLKDVQFVGNIQKIAAHA